MPNFCRKLGTYFQSSVRGMKNFKQLAFFNKKSPSPSILATLAASHGDSDVIQDSIKIMQRINQEKFSRLYQQFKDVSPSPGYSKYLDASTHVARGVRLAQALNLNHSPSLSVLDIGSGAGYFPFICQYYGHRSLALDVDGNDMYRQLKELLNVTCVYHTIKAFQTLPDLGIRLDVITCFQILFDRFDDELPWSPLEWNYFIEDLKTRLTPNGKIFLGLNTFKKAHEPILKKNLEFFRGLGARIQGGDVLLTNP